MSADGAGKVYMLRPGTEPPVGTKASGPAPASAASSAAADSDFAALTTLLNLRADLPPNAAVRPAVVVNAADKSVWQTAELMYIDVDWIVCDGSLEAMAQVHGLGESCAAVLVDLPPTGRGSGHMFIEALRSDMVGYTGPILAVTQNEFPAHRRKRAKTSGATGVMVFRSERMLHMLRCIAAGVTPVSAAPALPSGKTVQLSYPDWVTIIGRQLTLFLGPVAGGMVRRMYVDMHARDRVVPDPDALVLEASETLADWRDDRVAFVVACRAVLAEVKA